MRLKMHHPCQKQERLYKKVYVLDQNVIELDKKDLNKNLHQIQKWK